MAQKPSGLAFLCAESDRKLDQLEQKQRFQRILFPEGLAFDGEGFGTPATCLAFSYLREVSSRKSSLASRTGVEPVSPP